MACHEGSHKGDENGHDDSDSEEWAGAMLCGETGYGPRHTLPVKRPSSEETEVRSGKISWLEEVGKAVSSLILKWFPNTPDDLHSLPDFREWHSDLYWNDQLFQKVSKVAFKHAKLTFMQQSTKKILLQRYQNPKNYYLDGQSYYSPEFSSKIIARLILEQNGGDVTNSIQFIQSIFNITDKVIPKVNTLLIVSPPSAGKTYLVNSLANNFWPKGLVQNHVKGGGDFQWQDAVGCRFNIWNECLLMGESFIEQAKAVWEGDAVSVNVKHEKQKTLKRTPLFITCNKDPWSFTQSNKQAFLDRCVMYRWHRQPWLKKLDSYAVPSCWHLLFENSQRVEWWNDVPTTDVLVATRNEPLNDYATWLRSELDEEEWTELNTKYGF